MRTLALMTVFSVICLVASAQSTPASPLNSTPTLEYFSPGQVDKSVDPCLDFFHYVCSKWLKANPIPPDQAASGKFFALFIWNIAAVRNSLQEYASATGGNSVEQRVGEYYASCMDEVSINRAGITPLEPALARIARLQNTSQLPELVAYIHQIVRPGDLLTADAQYRAILFGLYPVPDFDDARFTLPALDQAGMGMPGREFYLNSDDKSKQIREKYLGHVARLLELSGEPKAQAAADAQSVLTI